MQSRTLHTVVCKLLESLLRDHHGRFSRKTAWVSKRTIVFNKLVRIYGNNIKVGR